MLRTRLPVSKALSALDMETKQFFDKFDRFYLPLCWIPFALTLGQLFQLIETGLRTNTLGTIYFFLWGFRIIYRVQLGYEISFGYSRLPGLNKKNDLIDRSIAFALGIAVVCISLWHLLKST